MNPSFPFAVTTGFEPKSGEWSKRVLTNSAEAVAALPNPHIPGGLTPSCDGPCETRVP